MGLFFKTKSPKIGLALGGGSAKGYAHIGVLKALHDYGIDIDFIAGSSAGALVGGLYAATKDVDQLEKLALDTSQSTFRSLLFDPTLRSGFIKGQKFIRFVRDQIGDIDFHDLQIPFVATGTDLHTGQTIELRTGNVAEAIQISCAIPVLFRPVEKDNQYMTDGGISMPVPVEIVRNAHMDIVLGVNLYKNYVENSSVVNLGMAKIFLNTQSIMVQHLAMENMRHADIQIMPDMQSIHWKMILNDQERIDTIQLGYRAMEEQIPFLKEQISRKTKRSWHLPF